ncbi:hypothetical protein ACFODT_13430, partial [Vibrio zhugei]
MQNNSSVITHIHQDIDDLLSHEIIPPYLMHKGIGKVMSREFGYPRIQLRSATLSNIKKLKPSPQI